RALAIDGDDLAVGVEIGDLRRAEIEHGPTRGIANRPPQRLRQAWPGQPDLHHRVLEMLRGQPRGAERPVLLLGMLQDQKCDAVIDRRDAVADAKRLWLLAMRTFRDYLGTLLLGGIGHPPPIRRADRRFNQAVLALKPDMAAPRISSVNGAK